MSTRTLESKQAAGIASPIAYSHTGQMGDQKSWGLEMYPGPCWNSYDQLKNSGSTAFEKIQPNCVGTVTTKTGVYRILRDSDFSKLFGLASDVSRIKKGVKFVVSAARCVQKHKDEESIELLIDLVSMLGDSPVLPEREGHEKMTITEEEAQQYRDQEEIDLNAIPRPNVSR